MHDGTILPQTSFYSTLDTLISMNFLIVAIALVAAQGGFIYGFDSGRQPSKSRRKKLANSIQEL